MARTNLSTFMALVASIATYSLPQPIDNAELIAQLKTDATRLDRFHDILTVNDTNLLSGQALKDATVFDFNKNFPVPGGEGGKVSTAYAKNFPILLDSGMSFSIASLGPCGVFFPHVHPRANEIFVVIEGEVGFGYMLESPVLPTPPTDPNAVLPIAPISGNLTKYTGTLFPQGSIHFQINHSCDLATVVATLSNDDAGTTPVLNQVAQGNMASTSPMQADIGSIENYYSILPPEIVSAAKQCVARCRK